MSEYTFAGSWSRSPRNVQAELGERTFYSRQPTSSSYDKSECGWNAATALVQIQRHCSIGLDVAFRFITFHLRRGSMKLRILRYIFLLCLFGGDRKSTR